jgi:hypothetical protein
LTNTIPCASLVLIPITLSAIQPDRPHGNSLLNRLLGFQKRITG